MTMLKPGYKQTDLGILPEEWKVEVLGNLTTKVGSGITPTGGSKVYKDHGRPFIRSQNVGWGTLLLDDVSHIDEATHSTFIGTEIKENDVLLNITGASIGRAAMADKRIVHGNVNQHVCIIRTNEKFLNPSFLASYLLSDKGQSIIDSFQTGGNRQGLNFQQIKSFQVALPPPDEQQAIADALGAVDALLSEQRTILTKKRNLKQATQIALLMGTLRLPNFSGEWQEKILGEVVYHLKGNSLGRSHLHKFGKNKCILYGELFTIYKEVIEQVVSRTNYDIGTPSCANDILFPGSTTTTGIDLATASVVKENGVLLGGDVIILRGYKDDFDPTFLVYYLKHIKKQEIAQATQGITIHHLYGKSLMPLIVQLPSIEEQQAIITVLESMDAEIDGVNAQLTKTEALKRGLMQDLLTGTIRLTGVAPFPTV